MASVATQQVSDHSTTFEPLVTMSSRRTKHHVHTQLNHYKEAEDGSPPAPAYVGKPDTKNDLLIRSMSPFMILVVKCRNTRWMAMAFKYTPLTDASRILIFDHTIRRGHKDQRGGVPTRGSVNRVHIDQSYDGARSLVPHHLPEDSDKLLTTRRQIINVWRPIKRILKDPLAVADAHSVPDSELVPVGLIYPDRQGETLTVRPNKQNKWYYLYGQSPEEVTLIKCYDSKLDGRTRRVPHTAFVNPATVDEEPRESIEVRALVFHEDQSAE